MPTQTKRPVKRQFSKSDRDVFRQMYDSLKTFRFADVSINIANMAAGAEVDTVVALPVADFGVVKATTHYLHPPMPPAALAAGIYARRWWISADNQVTLTTRNETGAGVDPGAQTWTFMVSAPLNISTEL